MLPSSDPGDPGGVPLGLPDLEEPCDLGDPERDLDPLCAGVTERLRDPDLTLVGVADLDRSGVTERLLDPLLDLLRDPLR